MAYMGRNNNLPFEFYVLQDCHPDSRPINNLSGDVTAGYASNSRSSDMLHLQNTSQPINNSGSTMLPFEMSYNLNLQQGARDKPVIMNNYINVGGFSSDPLGTSYNSKLQEGASNNGAVMDNNCTCMVHMVEPHAPRSIFDLAHLSGNSSAVSGSTLSHIFPLQNAPQSIRISESSRNPFGTSYNLGLQQRANNNAVVMNNHTSTVHKVGIPFGASYSIGLKGARNNTDVMSSHGPMVHKIQPLMPFLTSNVEASHLIESSTSAYKSTSDDMLALQNAPQSITLNHFGTSDNLPLQQGASDKFTIMDNSVPIVKEAEPLISSLPSNAEVSHLTTSRSSAPRPFQLSGKCTSSKKDGKSFKDGNNIANAVKGQWAAEEDRKLIELVEQFGAGRWSQISQMIPGRVGKQCRERWNNHLKPNVKKDTWSDLEDMILIQAHKELGTKWSEITKRLPGRTENTIKNRWNATKRKKLAPRSNIGTSKNPMSRNLLKDYINSLGPDPSNNITPPAATAPALPEYLPPQVAPLQEKNQNMKLDMATVQHTKEFYGMGDGTYFQTRPCEELVTHNSNHFCIEKCNCFLNTKEIHHPQH